MSKRCLTCGFYASENEKLKIRMAKLEAAARNVIKDRYTFQPCEDAIDALEKLLEGK